MTMIMIKILISVTLLLEQSSSFKIFWNLPSESCILDSNTSINLDNALIVHNTGHKWTGEYADRIVILYQNKFGMWPSLEGSNENVTSIYGGIPQIGNLRKHLEKVRKDIEATIPEENFNGIAVIDQEFWRALYEMNYGTLSKYQKASINLAARRKGLNVNNKTRKFIEKYAQEEFDTAARAWMTSTINLCRKLRPNAKWGYYLYPFVDYNAGTTNKTRPLEVTRRYAKRLLWLLNIVDILAPSIYLHSTWKSPDKNIPFSRVRTVISEAQRTNELLSVKKPIYAFAMFEKEAYKTDTQYYEDDLLCATLQTAMDMGIDGVIYWSTSNEMGKRCTRLADYINNHFAPYVQQMTNHGKHCSQKRCSSKGKCTIPNIIGSGKCKSFKNYKEYNCQCNKGWTGDHCDKETKKKTFSGDIYAGDFAK